MDPIARAALSSWDWRPEVIVVIVALAVLFAAGWLRLRKISGAPKSRHSLGATWRPISYLAGLLVIGLALLSPIDVLVQQLFFVHMIQHLLLIMVAPVLLMLPNPMPFLIWGLPERLRLGVGRALGGLLNKESVSGKIIRRLTKPVAVWFIMIVFIIGWHDPVMYQSALRSEVLHDFEHITMFAAGMLFAWTITGAGPRIHRELSPLAKVVFLIAAIPPHMALGVTLAFTPRPIYTYYLEMPRLWGISVMDDQRISGIIMWIPGSMMYFIAALVFVFKILSGEGKKRVLEQQAWNTDDVLMAPGVSTGSSGR